MPKLFISRQHVVEVQEAMHDVWTTTLDRVDPNHDFDESDEDDVMYSSCGL